MNLLNPVSRALAVALLVVTTACADEPPEVFVVDGTGSVQGFVFRDADNDGLFDPSAGDTALGNIRVSLRERGTASVIGSATTTTGANGRFTLANVPVGSHDLFIDTVGTGARGLAFCENPITLSVYRGEPRFVPVDARAGCVISIAEAEAKAQGTFVTIRGTVTAEPGTLRSNLIYVQDASGGIGVFGLTDPAIDVGDVIEVGGTLSNFNNELQLNSPRVVTLTDGGGSAVPRTVSTAQVTNAGLTATAPDQGRLVRVQRARLVSAFGTNTGSSQNAIVNDGSGNAELRIEDTVLPPAQLSTAFTVNRCYNITGILGAFRGTGQIKPRTPSDIQEVPCTP